MKPDLYTDIGDILQSMGDAFVSLDRQWRFNFINDKALRLMARSREELIGKTLWEAFPDTVGTIFESEYRRAMEHHVTTSFETYYPTYDMWLEVRAYPHNEGLSLFYTDITEQKKAGEDLLEISRRFQLFARLNPAGIFHLDHEGKWLFVNDLWLEMTGFDKGEVLGRTWTDVLQPENPEGDTWFGEESIKAGEFINSQFQFRHRRTGEILQIRMKATPIPAGDKKLKGYVGTIEDITEQLKAHQIITESEKWFRSIADNAPVMIWNSAADKSFNYFNKAWLRFTGRTLQQETRSGWTEGIFIEDVDRVLKTYHETFDLRGRFHTEYRLRHHDGTFRWVSDTGNPLYAPDGSFLGYTGSCTDIHEQVMVHQELEQRVRERTTELAAALEREKELNNMKSRFVSMASHEFRTPLSTVLSSISLVETYMNMNQPENFPKHIERIKASVRHLTGTLDDFLSLEKLEQGNVKMEKTVFDLRLFIATTSEEVENMLKPEQYIRCRFDGHHSICSDKKVIHNILLNLLSNAIKYSEQDIMLDAEVSTETVCITVTDQGIGIPTGDQGHLFSKYFRAANVGNVKGTGLGLSIVQRYVEILDGTIDFTSKEGAGTTFRVTFPRGIS